MIDTHFKLQFMHVCMNLLKHANLQSCIINYNLDISKTSKGWLSKMCDRQPYAYKHM